MKDKTGYYILGVILLGMFGFMVLIGFLTHGQRCSEDLFHSATVRNIQRDGDYCIAEVTNLTHPRMWYDWSSERVYDPIVKTEVRE